MRVWGLINVFSIAAAIELQAAAIELRGSVLQQGTLFGLCGRLWDICGRPGYSLALPNEGLFSGLQQGRLDF